MAEEQCMSAEDEIRALLKTYENLLNASDVRAAACYTSDGVFIPAGLPTVVGSAMADAYAGLFKVLRLELTAWSPTARCSCSGGKTGPGKLPATCSICPSDHPS